MKKYPIINRILALSLAAAMLVSAPMGAFTADAAGAATVAEVSDAAAISGDNNSQAAAGEGQKTGDSKKTDATTDTTTSGQASDSASITNKNSSASTDTVTIADDSVAMASEEGSDVVESDTWPGDNDIAVISDDTSETEAGTLTWKYKNSNTHKAKLVVVDQDGNKIQTDAYKNNNKIEKEYSNGQNLSQYNSSYPDYMSAIAKRDIEGYTFAGVYYKDSQGDYVRVANLSYNASGAEGYGWYYVKYTGSTSTVDSNWTLFKEQNGSASDEIKLYVIYNNNNNLQENNNIKLKLFYYSYDNGNLENIANTREVSVANDKDKRIDLSQYVKDISVSSGYTYDRASVFNTSGNISEDSNVADITITSNTDDIWKSAGWGDGNIAQELKFYEDKSTDFRQRVEVYVGGEKINDSYSYNPDRNGIAVVFIYEKNDSFDNKRVSTKDSIKINLFDYTISDTKSQSEANNNDGGINADHDLIFSTGQPGSTAGKYNIYDGNYRTAGIVKESLDANGMPVLNVGDNESLAYLFNTTSGANKRVDEGLDKLFKKDDDGYYVFDSASSFATISGNSVTGSKDFKVYNYASNSPTGFFPYTSHTLYGGNHQNYGDALGSQSTNHYVGMTIETSFVQPKDGQIDGKDMVFEFSGDDDVWVFIDGQLVLDLGGIHPKVSGTINFNTGAVTYTNAYSSTPSTVTANFKESSGKDWSAYTKHTLKMFYLERGNGASNCSIKMNLATIPEGGFIVAKDATGVDATIANDIDYKFVVKDESGKVCPGLKYTIVGDTGTTYTTDTEGCFTLKSGQCASFSVANDQTYTVSEIAATCKTSEDSTVSLNNFTTIARVVYSSTDKDSKTYSYAKNEADRYVPVSTSATDTPIVVFSNTYVDSSVIRPDDYIGKTAEVANYEDRTYNVTLQARKTTLELTGTGSAIDLILVMDTSASMLFHADLKETNITSIDKMNEELTYYGIRNNEAATVYEIKYEVSSSTWKYIDDSIDDWSSAKILDTSFLNEKLGGKLFTATSERTRYYYFKQTACNLIDKLPADSYFGLVTFNSSASINKISGNAVVKVTDSNRTTIKNIINDLGTSSGTRQDLGLSKARDLFNKNTSTLQNSGHNKYVVMISDGSPVVKDGTNVKASISSTKSSIEKIDDKQDKTKTTKIYSIGLDTSIHTSDRDYAEEVLKAVATSDDYYKSVTSANLDASIKSIIASITGLKLSTVITTGQVVDVIDPRFDLYDDDGNKVNSGGTYTIGGKQAEVTEEDGIYTVTWSDQTLGVKGTDGITPWTVTFKLKAKDDFLGGNVIATNGSDSGVKTGTGTDTKFEKFDQPAVNVKVLDFTLASDEEYVFKGDKFNVYKSDGSNGAYSWFLDNMSGPGAGILQDIIKDNDYSRWTKNADGTYTYTTPYSYGNTLDEIGTITYTFTPDITDSAIKTDGTALKVGSPVATWTMTVSYDPYRASDRQNSKTDLTLSNNPGTEVTETTSTGTYKDNVVTIALKLMKYGNGQNDAKYALANAEFTLSSGPLSGDKQTTADGTKGSTLGLITFADLKAGTYTLKETAAPEGWALNDTEYTVSITKQDSSQDDSGQAEKNFIYNVTVTHQNGEATVTDINCTVDLKQQLVKDTKDNSVTLADLADSQMLQLNVYDQIAYELPHTGGSGVYIYIISGILLMLVGALLLYKNKNNKKQ